ATTSPKQCAGGRSRRRAPALPERTLLPDKGGRLPSVLAERAPAYTAGARPSGWSFHAFSLEGRRTERGTRKHCDCCRKSPRAGSSRSPRLPTRSASRDRKSTRLNSSHGSISYAVFCLKKKKKSERLERVHRVQEQKI